MCVKREAAQHSTIGTPASAIPISTSASDTAVPISGLNALVSSSTSWQSISSGCTPYPPGCSPRNTSAHDTALPISGPDATTSIRTVTHLQWTHPRRSRINTSAPVTPKCRTGPRSNASPYLSPPVPQRQRCQPTALAPQDPAAPRGSASPVDAPLTYPRPHLSAPMPRRQQSRSAAPTPRCQAAPRGWARSHVSG